METFNYFFGWVLPSLQKSPLLWHAQSTHWHRLGLVSASPAFLCLLELRQGQCLDLGNNRVSLVSSLFDLHKMSSHSGRMLGLQRVSVFAGSGLAVGRQDVLPGGSEPPLPTGTCSLCSFPSAARGHCARDSQSKSLHPHKPLASG